MFSGAENLLLYILQSSEHLEDKPNFKKGGKMFCVYSASHQLTLRQEVKMLPFPLAQKSQNRMLSELGEECVRWHSLFRSLAILQCLNRNQRMI